jgi:hypothetical protein
MLQLVTRTGKVLKKFHLTVKMEQERIAGMSSRRCPLGHHLLQKFTGSLAFVVHGGLQAAAGIDRQAQAQRRCTGLREALDLLGSPVLSERYVGAGEVLHHLALLITHGNAQQDLRRLLVKHGRRLVAPGLIGTGRSTAGLLSLA